MFTYLNKCVEISHGQHCFVAVVVDVVVVVVVVAVVVASTAELIHPPLMPHQLAASARTG